MVLIKALTNRALLMLILITAAGLLFGACGASAAERVAKSPMLAQGES